MSLIKYLDKLLKACEELEVQPKEAWRECAELQEKREQQRRTLQKHREEMQAFEQIADLFGMSSTVSESTHVRTLRQSITSVQRLIEEYDWKIAEKKDYYRITEREDFLPLWKSEDEDRQMDALYYAIAAVKGDAVVDRVKGLLEARSNISEPVAKYLAGRSLISSEQKNVSDGARRRLDELLTPLLQNVSHFSEDEIWKSIECVLKIRATQRVLNECEAALKDYKAQMRDYERFSKSYQETVERLRSESKRIYHEIPFGKNISEATKKADKWYTSSIKELRNAVGERDRQQGEIELSHASLEGMQKKLQDGLEDGLDAGECSRLSDDVKQLKDRLKNYVAVDSLEKNLREYLQGYSRMVEEINAATARENAVKLERQNQRIRRRENRRSWKRRHRLFRFVRLLVILLVVPDVAAHYWAYNQPMWKIDEEGTLRINGSDTEWLGEETELFQIYPGLLYLVVEGKNYLEELVSFHNSKKIIAMLEESDGVLELPEEVDGVEPESLYLMADAAAPLKELVLPDSVRKIDNLYSTSLKTVNMENIEEIDYSAFRGYSSIPEDCSPLTDISLASLKILGDGAFYGNPSMDVVIATQLETVPARAFEACTAVQAAELPAATSLGDYAFADCTGLTAVNIPMVEEIGQSAFGGCMNLKEVYMESVKVIGASAFNTASATVGNQYAATAIEVLYLPNIESIGYLAFGRVYTLKQIYLGGTVQSVSEYAFPADNKQYEFILDSNATYSEEVMAVLQGYGVPISYVDFNSVSF